MSPASPTSISNASRTPGWRTSRASTWPGSTTCSRCRCCRSSIVVSLVSPFREDRLAARRLHEAAGLDFVEVFVDTPIEECARRDPKGLYARARAGRLTGMTGENAP